MKTQRIGSRIAITSSQGRWVATVDGGIPDWQRQSLELWFGAWIALGCMLGYGAFARPEGEQSFYVICLAFWTFFAVRAWRAVRWRRKGLEVIQLDGDRLTIRMDHGERQGRAHTLPLSDLDRIEVVPPNPRSFLESMDQQFWVVGGDRLIAHGGRRPLVFGKQLDATDAQALAKSLDKAIQASRQKG